MICVSLAASSADEILKLLEKLEFGEIRLDLCGLSLDEVRRVYSSARIPLVATCRPGTLPDAERYEQLLAAIDSGAAYVDIEIANPPEIIEKIVARAREKACRVIISYHNYKETPMKLVLQQAIDEAFDYGADIAKLVCRTRSIQDCSRLLSLYELRKNILALGLGELGAPLTCIAAPRLGAPFTYAALAPGKETVEGQPDYETLRSVLVLLKSPGSS